MLCQVHWGKLQLLIGVHLGKQFQIEVYRLFAYPERWKLYPRFVFGPAALGGLEPC